MLRHTFANRCNKSGVDVVTLSKILGHIDINKTMICVDVFGPQKQKEMKKFNEQQSTIFSTRNVRSIYFFVLSDRVNLSKSIL